MNAAFGFQYGILILNFPSCGTLLVVVIEIVNSLLRSPIMLEDGVNWVLANVSGKAVRVIPLVILSKGKPFELSMILT